MYVEPEVQKLWDALVSELPNNKLEANLGTWGFLVTKEATLTHYFLEGTYQVTAARDLPEGTSVLMWFKLSLTNIEGFDQSIFSYYTTSSLIEVKEDSTFWKELHEPHASIGEMFSRARSLEEVVRWRLRDSVFILDDYLSPDPNEE